MLKKRAIQFLIGTATVVCFALMSTSVSASIIVYDNTTTSLLGDRGQPGFFGDEINLGPGPRNVVEFEFKYTLYFLQGEPDPRGDETATVRFYKNDGAGGAPGTMLFDSGAFGILSGTTESSFTHTETLSIPNILVPDTFTWMVRFGGVIYPTLCLYNPPTVGSSDPDFFWSEPTSTPGNFLKDTYPGTSNFYARVSATPVPSTILLVGSGLIGLIGLRRRFRKE